MEKNVPAFVQEGLETRVSDETRPVLMMAEDEGRVGLINTLQRWWVPQPLRPVVARHMVRQFLYGFAAVCPQFGPITALMVPDAHHQMMTLLLAPVAAARSAYCIGMLVDRAGWQLSHHGTVPEHMRRLPQPPGSPALNPPEQLWED